MNFKEPRHMEYVRCIELLSKLISLDDNVKEKIYKCFRSMGVKNFFLHLDLIDLPHEIYEKLQDIKTVIEVFDNEWGQV